MLMGAGDTIVLLCVGDGATVGGEGTFAHSNKRHATYAPSPLAGLDRDTGISSSCGLGTRPLLGLRGRGGGSAMLLNYLLNLYCTPLHM